MTKREYISQMAKLRLNFYLIVGSTLIIIITPLILVYIKHFNFLKVVFIGFVIALLWTLINISAFKSAINKKNADNLK